ncbi:MAG: DUF2207 domain-containing protein [Propionibacteriaceae bacterium]|nr:DUF2207 domain-containing protein [Propionibacteriaceae bacterium]
MRRVLSWLAAVTAALLLLPATPAAADDDHPSWRIPNYDVTATVDPEGGVTHVQLDIAFDFANDPGHGPYVTLPLRQEIEDDPDHWRMLDVTVVGASSPSGADATVQTREESGNLLIRLGSEGRTFTGVQRYRISYSIRGLLATNQAQSGLDEFNWNVVGPGWEVRIGEVTASITGPADVQRVACFAGDWFASECDEAAYDGHTATFRQLSLGKGNPLQIVAGFPAGTFTGAEPRLTTRFHIGNMFPVTPVTGGLTAVLTALGLGWLFRRTRRGARDQVYLGLTPGMTPAPNQQAVIGEGTARAPVAVQFTPPANARPGELGVLTDHTADNTDITATMMDLAVRGYLKIEQTGKKDWTFTRLATSQGLVEYERHLFEGLFREGSVVETDDLKDSSYADLLTGTRSRMYNRVTKDLNWFTRNPSTVRAIAVVGGIGLIGVGAVLGIGLGFVGFGLLGLAGLLTGIGVLIANNRFGARTADGSAVLAQTKGFELYLSTAEADQIRFEEGIDVFSRYLPYAVIFGVAERWTKVFAQLEAQGRYTPTTGWYVGYGYGTMLSSDFASSMDRMASQMSSSLQHATAASSGGSGFSGGGGFGGGGGGGW